MRPEKRQPALRATAKIAWHTQISWGGFGPLISAFGAATDQPVAKEFVR